MPIQIQLRRGTASEWAATNPVLAEGEMGLEKDTGKFKIGTGALAWNALPYNSGATGPQGLTPIFTRQGTLSTMTGTQRIYVERSGTIAVVRATVGTPSTGSAILVDVNKNGSSVLTTPISISAAAYTATGIISSSSVSAGDYFTVDIDSVGSTTAGANLTVTLTIS
jgi:hypothetical protein